MNPYQPSSGPLPDDIRQPTKEAFWPHRSTRLLFAFLLATTVSVTMWASLTASFAVGLIDVIKSGFLFRGGILVYATEVLAILPILNLIGAVAVCELLPRLRPKPTHIPILTSVVVLHVIAYFATATIDTQQFVKKTSLSGRPLTITTVLVPLAIWAAALIVAIALMQVHQRIRRPK